MQTIQFYENYLIYYDTICILSSRAFTRNRTGLKKIERKDYVYKFKILSSFGKLGMESFQLNILEGKQVTY